MWCELFSWYQLFNKLSLNSNPQLNLGFLDRPTTSILAMVNNAVISPIAGVCVQQKLSSFSLACVGHRNAFKTLVNIFRIDSSQEGCLQKHLISASDIWIWPCNGALVGQGSPQHMTYLTLLTLYHIWEHTTNHNYQSCTSLTVDANCGIVWMFHTVNQHTKNN